MKGLIATAFLRQSLYLASLIQHRGIRFCGTTLGRLIQERWRMSWFAEGIGWMLLQKRKNDCATMIWDVDQRLGGGDWESFERGRIGGWRRAEWGLGRLWGTTILGRRRRKHEMGAPENIIRRFVLLSTISNRIREDNEGEKEKKGDPNDNQLLLEWGKRAEMVRPRALYTKWKPKGNHWCVYTMKMSCGNKA